MELFLVSIGFLIGVSVGFLLSQNTRFNSACQNHQASFGASQNRQSERSKKRRRYVA